MKQLIGNSQQQLFHECAFKFMTVFMVIKPNLVKQRLLMDKKLFVEYVFLVPERGKSCIVHHK
jgi:hypothetical protein